MTSMWNVIVAAIYLGICLKTSEASGTFELQILGIQNYQGEREDGSCCGDYRTKEGTCSIQCNTAFRLCLKEYQSQVEPTGKCTFGNQSTPVVAGNSFSVQSEPNKEVILRLPFTFSWTVSNILYYKCEQNFGRYFLCEQLSNLN